MANTEKNKGGRPKFTINYELVDELAKIQCTKQEIAAVLGCSISTLTADKEFLERYKTGSDHGKTSLRRFQFKLAEHNTAMAIWLGKQWLGQKEQPIEDDDVTSRLKEVIAAIESGKNK